MKKGILGLFFFGVIGFIVNSYIPDNSKTMIDKEIIVYQSRACGCCKKWVEHLKANGMRAVSHFVDDVTETKLSADLPMKLASCHTAFINGYIIEGHVPAAAIQKLLSEKPAIKGLAVPGMPMGSPGMEGSYKESFDVIAFEKDGKERVFMKF